MHNQIQLRNSPHPLSSVLKADLKTVSPKVLKEIKDKKKILNNAYLLMIPRCLVWFVALILTSYSIVNL